MTATNIRTRTVPAAQANASADHDRHADGHGGAAGDPGGETAHAIRAPESDPGPATTTAAA